MSTFNPAYRLRLYAHKSVDAAEATVLTPRAGASHSDPFAITTLPVLTGYKPYLDLPQGRRGRIDILSKKTDVGELSLRILDAKHSSVTDNLTRWMTAFLGDTQSLNQLQGCKIWVQESIFPATGTGASGSFTATNSPPWTTNSEAGRQVDLYTADPRTGGTLVLATTVTSNTTTVLSFSGNATGATYALVWASYFTGRVKSGALDGSRIWYALNVQDMSRVLKGDIFVGKPHASVASYAGLIALAPVGNIAAYGMAPAVAPLKGTVTASDTGTGSITITLDDTSRRRADAIVTQNLVDAVGASYVIEETLFTTGAAGSSGRRFTGTARMHLKRTDTQAQGEMFVGKVVWIYEVYLNAGGDNFAGLRGGPQLRRIDVKPMTVGGLANPPVSTPVEFYLYKDARMHDDNLLLINDVHPAQLFRDILDGYFGQLWTEFDTKDGASLPPGVAYGDAKRKVGYVSSAFTTLINDASFPKMRVPVADTMPMDQFIQKYICPVGLAYYLNEDGQVVPVDVRHPTSVAGVGTITNADLDTTAIPEWDWDANGAISYAYGKYYAENFSVPLVAGLEGITGNGTPTGTFAKITNKLINNAAQEVYLFGLSREMTVDDRPYVVDAIGLRYQPFEWIGWFAARQVWAEGKLTDMLRYPQRMFARGPATIRLRCRRTANTNDCQPGTLKIIDVDEIPDPATNLRGGARLLRCLERAERGLLVDLAFIDLGLSAQATAPTLGAPTTIAGDTYNGAQCLITLNASAQPVEWGWATTSTGTVTAPADSDSAWVSGGRRDATGTVQATGLPSGTKVWFRARTFDPKGELQPSGWVNSTSVTLSTLSAPTTLGTSVKTDQCTITWTNVDTTHEIALYLVTPITDPLELIARLPRQTSKWVIWGLQPSTQYKVELRADDGHGGQSAGLTTNFTTSATGSAQTCPAAGSVTIVLDDSTMGA